MRKIGQAVVMLSLCTPLLMAASRPDESEYVEIPTGTKLCDPGEDVYGYYVIKGPMNTDQTQDVTYFRFGALYNSEAALQQRIQQSIGGSTRWIKRHPREKNKLQVINPVTGEADEFSYAPCKVQ